eukprot:CAMPEP_0194308906 /NCGR_PEP_ID=MMETSP0171-20130528/5866_1 /TAXON_ID=218684 /ORGANISM="Corethron pennatum, Strain L29A3" /LENGTH=368 /DNA_ID=CAMNT_0039061779 /DNA_START=143 /DNA_END=1249 /DNA_ORIENTATION=-
MQTPFRTSDSLNCVGSHSEDWSDAEFVPCPNTTFPSLVQTLQPANMIDSFIPTTIPIPSSIPIPIQTHKKSTLPSLLPSLPPMTLPSSISNPGEKQKQLEGPTAAPTGSIFLIDDPANIFDPSDTKLSCSRNEGYQIDESIFGTAMNFAYSIETSTREIDVLLISNLEKVILRSLDGSILDCSSSFLENGSSRKLLSDDKSSNGLVSVDSSPRDKISDEICSPKDENAQACYVIEGVMTLYFTSDDVNMIMDAKKKVLKSMLLSMAGGELLSDDMPSLLRVSYLGPYVTEEIGKRAIDTAGEEYEDLGTLNTVFITMGSTIFVAVFAYLVRGRFLSRQPAESNVSIHDGSIHDDSVHDDSIHVEPEAV